MTLQLQANCADSGAIVQIWSDKPLSSWDVEELKLELDLLLRQAKRREEKQQQVEKTTSP